MKHKEMGYLAKPLEADDLVYEIEWPLNNNDYDELCENARDKVLKEFDSKIVAQQCIQLYKEILNG